MKTPHILWVIVLTASVTFGCGAQEREHPPFEASTGDIWIRATDGMEMVFVPAGQFAMGSSSTDLAHTLELCAVYYDDCELGWFKDEMPQHTVIVDSFWMDRTEVSNGQFADFLNVMPNRREKGMFWLDEEHGQIERIDGRYVSKNGYENYPVVEVTWHAADAYCHWVGGRLPTEAEWEYAARGQSKVASFPWGEQLDGDRLNLCDVNCELEWADQSIDDGYSRTAPVGSYPQGESWSGVLDMAGNVYEWVSDWYASDYYERSSTYNPPGPPTGENRVLRGGSWHLGPVSARSTNRLEMNPQVTHDRWGFRCVLASE
jgi:formylglycine-generating enzyme required for sulfatase activity